MCEVVLMSNCAKCFTKLYECLITAEPINPAPPVMIIFCMRINNFCLFESKNHSVSMPECVLYRLFH